MRKIFFITIPTLLIFLVALELGLRMCGFLYAQRHPPEAYEETKKFDTNEFRILCLGDSFTLGVGADFEGSYPRQLEKILQRNASGKIRVINGGCLANTSSLLLKKLQTDINRHSPSAIVIMIGMSNNWNLEGSSYFLLNDGSMRFLKRLERLLSALSLYKLLRIGLDKFKMKTDVRLEKSDNNGLKSKTELQMIELRSVGDSLLREGKNDLAIEKAKEALKIDNTDPAAHLILAQGLSARGEHQAAKEELWRTIYLVKEWDANLICGIMHQLKAIDPNDDLVLLKTYFQTKVEKSKRDALIKMLEASLDLYDNEKIFKAVLNYDLEQIAKLVKKRGIRLVFQNYPLGGTLNLNSAIAEASQKYDIYLVNNEAVFKGKARSELFVVDGHCNEKGYKLIAENVYDALVKNKMLPEESMGVRGDGK